VIADPQRLPVLGLPIAATSYAEVTRWCREKASEAARPYAVSAANTHLVALARHDRGFGRTMRSFDLICPDGMPLVWTLNGKLPKSVSLNDRVYGPTLMLQVLRATEGVAGESHFFLGGKESTLKKLRNRFSGNEIAGTYSPPFGDWPEAEHEKIIALIRSSGAKYVWVGLGCPKQEEWIATHLEVLPPAVYFGVGAAFAFHAGEVRQAPALFQKAGLEWLYRLLAEPRRLWKRYAVYNSLFLYYLIRDQMREEGEIPSGATR